MPKESLKSKIVYYLKDYPGWCHSGTLELVAQGNGYKGENGGRRARELVNEGVIERKIEKGSVWYRYKPQNIAEIAGKKVEIFAPKKKEESKLL